MIWVEAPGLFQCPAEMAHDTQEAEACSSVVVHETGPPPGKLSVESQALRAAHRARWRDHGKLPECTPSPVLGWGSRVLFYQHRAHWPCDEVSHTPPGNAER